MINSITSVAVPGNRECKTPKKFWSQSIKHNVTMCVTCWVLTRSTGHEELASDVAWCCLPYRMRNLQHPDFKVWIQYVDDDWWIIIVIIIHYNHHHRHHTVITIITIWLLCIIMIFFMKSFCPMVVSPQ